MRFLRGDADSSGDIDINDGVSGLNYLFLGGPAPSCLDAFDTDDDGQLTVGDGIGVFNYLFLGGEAPEAPFPGCGADLTKDPLTCGEFTACP